MNLLTRTAGLVLFCTFFLTAYAAADTYSGSSPHEAVVVRAPIWVFLEQQPGADKEKAEPPRKVLTDIARYVLSGMVYGWKFFYTPYDAKRNVAEEFELTPVHTIDTADAGLVLTDLKPQYPYLYCWAEYRMPEIIAKRRTQWMTARSITAQGSGSGNRKDEAAGMYHAYNQAVLAAVRTYLRKVEKNKPKQVRGELLIKDNPRLTASSGLFTAHLTIVLTVDEVVRYEVF